MEIRSVIPRIAVRKLFHEVLHMGKRIILCSDMYLSSEQIGLLLEKCGYPRNLEIWVSCECGGTKSSGVLWKKLFSSLPDHQKVIHIGDNECSDYRILKQMHREAILLSSGYCSFQQSPL